MLSRQRKSETAIKARDDRSSSNAHIILQPTPTSKTKRRNLLTWDELPTWQQDNHYILTNYRPASNSFLESFRSLTYLHNESVNIYSHLIPSITVLCFLLLIPIASSLDRHLLHYFLPTATPSDALAFAFFFAGFCLCLFTSAMYHTCSNHSEICASYGNKLDYLGIVLLITGSFIPTVYYGFTPHPSLRHVYWTMISALGAGCAVVSVSPRFRTPAYRPVRASMFVGMGLSAVVPVLHGLYLYGPARLDRQIGLKWVLLQGALYILGAAMYAARVPEKWRPGGFDVWGSSHQIFHVLVVAASISHFVGLLRAAEYAHGLIF